MRQVILLVVLALLVCESSQIEFGKIKNEVFKYGESRQYQISVDWSMISQVQILGSTNNRLGTFDLTIGKGDNIIQKKKLSAFNSLQLLDYITKNKNSFCVNSQTCVIDFKITANDKSDELAQRETGFSISLLLITFSPNYETCPIEFGVEKLEFFQYQGLPDLKAATINVQKFKFVYNFNGSHPSNFAILTNYFAPLNQVLSRDAISNNSVQDFPTLTSDLTSTLENLIKSGDSKNADLIEVQGQSKQKALITVFVLSKQSYSTTPLTIQTYKKQNNHNEEIVDQISFTNNGDYLTRNFFFGFRQPAHQSKLISYYKLKLSAQSRENFEVQVCQKTKCHIFYADGIFPLDSKIQDVALIVKNPTSKRFQIKITDVTEVTPEDLKEQERRDQAELEKQKEEENLRIQLEKQKELEQKRKDEQSKLQKEEEERQRLAEEEDKKNKVDKQLDQAEIDKQKEIIKKEKEAREKEEKELLEKVQKEKEIEDQKRKEELEKLEEQEKVVINQPKSKNEESQKFYLIGGLLFLTIVGSCIYYCVTEIKQHDPEEINDLSNNQDDAGHETNDNQIQIEVPSVQKIQTNKNSKNKYQHQEDEGDDEEDKSDE